MIATSLCVLAIVAGINSECIDWLPKCQQLDEVYCSAPYDVLASQVCAKRCGLCDDNNSINKRSHGHQPDWIDHCWDNNANHIQDPFCSLLTTTTTPKPTTPTTTPPTTTTVPTTTTTEATTTTTEPTTTTTEPTTTTTEATTTTTEPTTTTTEPPTTTTEPTTTTTMPTTTTEPPTTTTTLPPTTTERVCFYKMFNGSDITDTDFGTDIQLVQNANITLNDSVHLLGNIDFCQSMCAQSFLNDGLECWAFTYNEYDKCYMYYYNRPLSLLTEETFGDNVTDTQLFLKRCSDDPITTARPTTQPPTTEMPTTEDLGNTIIRPSVTMPTVVNATEIVNTTQIIYGTSIITIINSTTEAPTDGPPPMKTSTTTEAGPVGPSPGGIIYVSATSYKMIGGKSPVPGMCYFLNQTFDQGEHWKDTCRYDCECFDANSNTEMCQDVCPHYTSIPAGCTIVQEAGQCCPQIDCGNNTNFINKTDVNVSGSGDGSDCKDVLEKCDYYEEEACVGLYKPWAQANCALRCGYCDYKAPCIDRLTYCGLYELDTVCTDYSGWARYNCKRSCNKCQ